jgi:hypothetical protein
LTPAANRAGLACLPFVIVWLVDGFWKARLSASAPPLFWSVDIAEWILLPAVSLWMLHRFSSINPKDYGLASPRTAPFLAALFLCTITLFAANWLGNSVLGPLLFGRARDVFDYGKALTGNNAVSLAGAFYLAATAAVCESLFAIGLPWLWFSQGEAVSRRGRLAFMLAASFIFGLAHWESGWPVATGAFLFQLGALAWYFGLRSLWPIMGAHFLIDLYWFWPR